MPATVRIETAAATATWKLQSTSGEWVLMHAAEIRRSRFLWPLIITLANSRCQSVHPTIDLTMVSVRDGLQGDVSRPASTCNRPIAQSFGPGNQ